MESKPKICARVASASMDKLATENAWSVQPAISVGNSAHAPISVVVGRKRAFPLESDSCSFDRDGELMALGKRGDELFVFFGRHVPKFKRMSELPEVLAINLPQRHLGARPVHLYLLAILREPQHFQHQGAP